jgi:hypothetical protein
VRTELLTIAHLLCIVARFGRLVTVNSAITATSRSGVSGAGSGSIRIRLSLAILGLVVRGVIKVARVISTSGAIARIVSCIQPFISENCKINTLAPKNLQHRSNYKKQLKLGKGTILELVSYCKHFVDYKSI